MATTDETISIPLELYFNNNNSIDNNENKINISNPYNNINKDDDINENLNIDKINNNSDKKEEHGFEVIENEDFINALNSKNNKSK